MISCAGFSVSNIYGTHQGDFHEPVHKDAAHAGLHVILHTVDIADQRPPSPLQGSGQQWSGRAAVEHDTAMHELPWSHRDTRWGGAISALCTSAQRGSLDGVVLHVSDWLYLL